MAKSGDEDVTGITSLVPEIKNSSLQNGLRPGVIGLLRQVAYEVIPADREHFKSLT